MKGNGNDMENENNIVRNACKKMHGVWINALAMKNGYGNGMLYGLTIGGIQNLLQKGRCKVMVVELDLSLDYFMNLVFGRPIVITM